MHPCNKDRNFCQANIQTNNYRDWINIKYFSMIDLCFVAYSSKNSNCARICSTCYTTVSFGGITIYFNLIVLSYVQNSLLKQKIDGCFAYNSQPRALSIKNSNETGIFIRICKPIYITYYKYIMYLTLCL